MPFLKNEFQLIYSKTNRQLMLKRKFKAQTTELNLFLMSRNMPKPPANCSFTGLIFGYCCSKTPFSTGCIKVYSSPKPTKSRKHCGIGTFICTVFTKIDWTAVMHRRRLLLFGLVYVEMVQIDVVLFMFVSF